MRTVNPFGIDFGTTQTKMAYVDQTGTPIIVSNERGEQTTPTALAIQESGEVLIGTDALELGVLHPSSVAQNFKLKLGSTESLLMDRRLTPTDAAKLFIQKLKEDAEKSRGTAITDVVVTCPANFPDASRAALLEAFADCGLNVLRLMPEPSAAGFAYLHDKHLDKGKLAVFDFGGGTFDFSILEVNGQQITVLATEGVATLGGNDISQVLMNSVLDAVEKKTKRRPTPESEPLFFLEHWRKVEAAKISLGKQKEVPIVVSHNGETIKVVVNQEEFHKAILPLVQQSFDASDKAVEAAGLGYKNIDRLVMVGGTSRMPFIQDKLAEHTSLIPKMDIDPQQAIAYGAALCCVSEITRRGDTASVDGKVIPDSGRFLKDVTGHAIGCCVVDTADAGKRLVNATIIPKNTPIPCQRSECFFLENEKQISVTLEILQGDNNADRDDCLLIGELTLDNLPTEPIKTKRILIEYWIDENGMATVTATDKVSKRSRTVTVDYKKGIKPKDKPVAA